MNDIKITRHLDLGCGSAIRNPYDRNELYGCDLKEFPQDIKIENFTFVSVDLSKSKLPFPDNYFDSVSAFDFIEHIPRQSFDHNGNIRSPFIDLMNEIHRVLLPNGLFLASTPAYPRPEVFQDPTHVNFITDKSHSYFCGDEPYGARYGFLGKFLVKKVKWESQKNLIDNKSSSFRKWYRDMEHKFFKGGLSHLTWELIKTK
jgi:SAM-dependent methyltransferase